MRPILAHFMANRYTQIKAENPGKGRRYRKLCVLEAFWASFPSEPGKNEHTKLPPEPAMNLFTEDDEPYDLFTSDVVGGIVLRTDYSDEDSWNVFLAKLNEELSEGAQENTSEHANVEMEDEDENSDEEEEEGKLIKVINPSSPEERAIFENISNLRALRLFNDVDIQPAPLVPAGTKPISPPNRLADAFGWQEVYTGITIWIYDAQSNSDRSARLVSGSGDSEVYGTAAGDSWRAQVSHIPELQLSMTFENMKINFGGLDRWDYSERKRNLEEANVFAV
ncbi:hypothetical protein D9757_005684 [Collybiopsis confluens]|uniref:Uncharacterized protein n=1 Tax=Collybiopsis confluens TaxID=2823264 RepID=A0A8H5HSU0_9AGAR|nr:hypothetical protein D9757_005684 [Collybiopsis confluens]